MYITRNPFKLQTINLPCTSYDVWIIPLEQIGPGPKTGTPGHLQARNRFFYVHWRIYPTRTRLEGVPATFGKYILGYSFVFTAILGGYPPGTRLTAGYTGTRGPNTRRV